MPSHMQRIMVFDLRQRKEPVRCTNSVHFRKKRVVRKRRATKQANEVSNTMTSFFQFMQFFAYKFENEQEEVHFVTMGVYGC